MGATQGKKGGCLQQIAGGFVILLLIAGIRACIGGDPAPPSPQTPAAAPAAAPGSTVAAAPKPAVVQPSAADRLRAIEEQQRLAEQQAAEERQWRLRSAALLKSVKKVAGIAKADINGDSDASRITVEVTTRDLVKPLDGACRVLREGGYLPPDGSALVLASHIPPDVDVSGKWGSVARAVQGVHGWRRCVDPTRLGALEGWVAQTQPRVADMVGGQWRVGQDGILRLVITPATLPNDAPQEKQTKLYLDERAANARLAIAACAKAKELNSRLIGVEFVKAPNSPDPKPEPRRGYKSDPPPPDVVTCD
ncbi:MAG: hypothetical protein HQL42_13070 [Alphaproteobacteria bacterium]|nr:hypothetical protein [Alphaproteobacteria bacterium]